MKVKSILIFFALLFLIFFPLCAQTLVGKAAGDFYSAFALMGRDRTQLRSLEDLSPYITADVRERLQDNLVYRAAFISYAANQCGIITGNTSSVGFAETLNALTGFLMIIEEGGEITEWTVREITGKYEQLLASSWRNVSPPLFAVMLEAYCAYMRGELWPTSPGGVER